MEKLRFIANHLPQFHPFKENDEWWGKGFTEWTNVAKAQSYFKGHYQPHLPADLGYYDLRLPEARAAQAAMAKEYGIDGFSYYHYWFHGKRLMGRPVDEIIESKEPDFPFLLFWANETWSRRWLGEDKEVLIKQTYSEKDDYDHAAYLAAVFSDHRYILHKGRPLFIIYKPVEIPDVSRTIDIFKEVSVKRNAVEPFIVASNAHTSNHAELLGKGFDAVFNFRPQLGCLPHAMGDGFLKQRLKRNIRGHRVFNGVNKIYSYAEALDAMARIEPGTYENLIPNILVGFDNSPRRGEHGIILTENSPELFKQEFLRVITKLKKSPCNNGMIFINAWNEWAEGNHLEPDQKYGYAYLQVVKEMSEKYK